MYSKMLLMLLIFVATGNSIPSSVPAQKEYVVYGSDAEVGEAKDLWPHQLSGNYYRTTNTRLFGHLNLQPRSVPLMYNFVGKTFWGAWRACHSRGQRLATVVSAAESKLLQRTIEQADVSDERLWIGATDQGAEGKWIWISTGTNIDLVTGYTNWSKGQPDNGRGSENCVQVGGEGDVTWHDESCYYRRGFICERERRNEEELLE